MEDPKQLQGDQDFHFLVYKVMIGKSYCQKHNPSKSGSKSTLINESNEKLPP